MKSRLILVLLGASVALSLISVPALGVGAPAQHEEQPGTAEREENEDDREEPENEQASENAGQRPSGFRMRNRAAQWDNARIHTERSPTNVRSLAQMPAGLRERVGKLIALGVHPDGDTQSALQRDLLKSLNDQEIENENEERADQAVIDKKIDRIAWRAIDEVNRFRTDLEALRESMLQTGVREAAIKQVEGQILDTEYQLQRLGRATTQLRERLITLGRARPFVEREIRQEEIVQKTALTGGQVAETFRVTLDENGQQREYVFKKEPKGPMEIVPDGWRGLLPDNVDRPAMVTLRSAATYAVARELGLERMVAESKPVLLDGEFGQLMEYVPYSDQVFMDYVSETARDEESGNWVLAKFKEANSSNDTMALADLYRANLVSVGKVYQKNRFLNPKVDFEHWKLRQALSNAEVLDLLTLQIDRHAGNYLMKVEDDNSVSELKLIDNDAAFGATDQFDIAPKLPPMPRVMDMELANRLLEPDLASRLESAVARYLDPNEVRGLKARLRALQDRARTLAEQGNLVIARGQPWSNIRPETFTKDEPRYWDEDATELFTFADGKQGSRGGYFPNASKEGSAPPETGWRPLARPSPAEIETTYGIPVVNQEAIERVAREKEVIVLARPTNPASVEWLKAGYPPKPVQLKAKTVNLLDTMLGMHPADVGKVAYFSPIANGKELATLDAAQLKAELDAMDNDALAERARQRTAEYKNLKDAMTELETNGAIEVRNGVVINKGLLNSGMDKAFTGDHDLFQIADAKTNLPIDEDRAREIVQALESFGVAHGAHLAWKPQGPVESDIYGRIIKQHLLVDRLEPLIEFGSLTPRTLAYFDPPPPSPRAEDVLEPRPPRPGAVAAGQ